MLLLLVTPFITSAIPVRTRPLLDRLMSAVQRAERIGERLRHATYSKGTDRNDGRRHYRRTVRRIGNAAGDWKTGDSGVRTRGKRGKSVGQRLSSPHVSLCLRSNFISIISPAFYKFARLHEARGITLRCGGREGNTEE